MGQLLGVKQTVAMHSLAGPATGHTVMLYLAQGPFGGGVTVTLAVVGLMGSAFTAGDLHTHKHINKLEKSVSKH